MKVKVKWLTMKASLKKKSVTDFEEGCKNRGEK